MFKTLYQDPKDNGRNIGAGTTLLFLDVDSTVDTNQIRKHNHNGGTGSTLWMKCIILLGYGATKIVVSLKGCMPLRGPYFLERKKTGHLPNFIFHIFLSFTFFPSLTFFSFFPSTFVTHYFLFSFISLIYTFRFHP